MKLSELLNMGTIFTISLASITCVHQFVRNQNSSWVKFSNTDRQIVMAIIPNNKYYRSRLFLSLRLFPLFYSVRGGLVTRTWKTKEKRETKSRQGHSLVHWRQPPWRLIHVQNFSALRRLIHRNVLRLRRMIHLATTNPDGFPTYNCASIKHPNTLIHSHKRCLKSPHISPKHDCDLEFSCASFCDRNRYRCQSPAMSKSVLSVYMTIRLLLHDFSNFA